MLPEGARQVRGVDEAAFLGNGCHRAIRMRQQPARVVEAQPVREGQHAGESTYAWVNQVPRFAMRCMLGVRTGEG